MDYAAWIERGLVKVGGRGGKTETIAELAKRMKISPSHFYTYKRGEIIPTKKQIAIMAEFFGEEPPTAKKRNGAAHHGANNVVHLRPAGAAVTGQEWIPYPILGVVDAGAFREPDLLDQVEPKEFPGERNPTHPNASPMAWVARGDSMNEERIFDGTILFGVNFQEAGGVLSNDTIVVVQQSRGGLIERSVKAVAVFQDRVEFQPRSSNPAHRPIVFRKNEQDDDVEVKVLTIIHGTYNSVRR